MLIKDGPVTWQMEPGERFAHAKMQSGSLSGHRKTVRSRAMRKQLPGGGSECTVQRSGTLFVEGSARFLLTD